MIRFRTFSIPISKDMHPEILTQEQIELLPLLKKFRRTFILVGGTAIALHLGHRRSIDFDLFSTKKINSDLIFEKISEKKIKIEKIQVRKEHNHTMMIHGVQMTFFYYSYPLSATKTLRDSCRIPSLLDLAAMKAHALGGRGKWKDYVDLYFILKEHHSFQQISKRAKEWFQGEFNERLFRQQLTYFDDINYSQIVEYMESPIPEEEIKKFLKNVGTSL